MNILKKYKRHKKISNLTIVFLSLTIAIWINFFVLEGSNFSKNLKTNLLESELKNNISNIYFEKKGNNLFLKTNRTISNIENLTFSITYNPENIEILDIIPKLNSEIINVSNTPWLSTVLVNFKEINTINSWEKILTIKTNKKEDKTENVNIINANFTDSEKNTFELSVSWIIF